MRQTRVRPARSGPNPAVAETIRMHEEEQALVAGRDPFTVFRWGSKWLYVMWSRRPSPLYETPEDAEQEAKEDRTMYGREDWPVRVEGRIRGVRRR